MEDRVQKIYFQGLMAQWFDKLMEHEWKDIDYYKNVATSREGSMLELGCGTGRILMPILAMGMDIEGMDVSGAMLDICREKLEKNFLTTKLYEQSITSLDTGKKYRTIFIAGAAYRLVGDLDQAMTSLEAIYQHLEPGGMFVCDLNNPGWSFRTYRDNTWKLGRTVTNEKGESLWYWWCSEYNVQEQVQIYRTKHELFKDDMLVETRIAESTLRWYGKYEFKLMLEKAGFVDVDMEAVDIVSGPGRDMVYRAYKKK